ncbi:MAG: chemotaxis protein, partial [Betaproteobacteria bacterium]
MSVKNRIWMLPLLAILIFAVGIATVLAFSARTSKSIQELGSVDYPYLDATTQLEGLGATIQSAVAEGEKKRLEEATDRAATMRKTIAAIKAIPGKAEAGETLGKLFETYFAASTDTAQMFLGTKTGDQAAAVAAMQGSQKALEANLKSARESARNRFDAGLGGAQGGVSASLYATLASALLVVVGLGLGSYFVIGSVWRQLGGEPEYARDVMRRIAAGDLSQVIQVQPGANNSLLAAVRDMSGGLAAIVGEVRSGSSRMRLAAQEIASGNQDLSERTEMQAASLERTTARMHQLTETVQSNAANAHQASDLASSASSVASRGGSVVSQVVSTM